MKQKVTQILNRIRKNKQIKIDVKIEDCRHFCGFIYGKGSVTNPYQDYIVGLQNGENKEVLRSKFIDFLALYKPNNLEEAIDVPLNRVYPLWTYPWRKYTTESFNNTTNWYDDIFDIPDIITHFSKKGVFRYRIEEEFVWMEKALKSIKKYGYMPEKFNSYATVCQLVTNNGESVYILLDGNHRASALFAIGVTHFTCILQNVYYEKDIKNWAAVKDNFFTLKDAQSILYAYVKGNIRNYYDQLLKENLIIIE